MPQTLGETDGFLKRCFGKDDDELFAAVAGGPVELFAQFGAQAHAHGAQYGVAGGVSVFVVDRFEMIDVHENDGHWPVVARSAHDLGGEPLLKVTPVVAAGERVGERQCPDFGQRLFKLPGAFGNLRVQGVDMVTDARLQCPEAIGDQIEFIAATVVWPVEVKRGAQFVGG